MNDFYKKRHDFFRNAYWSNENQDVLIANGFTIYPNEVYNYFVDIIDSINRQKEATVMDVCCGNGLLLKHLMEYCNSKIIPYGIDFIKPSITQALIKIHPNNRDNFFLSNAADFDFSKWNFDFVLLDPYHFDTKDLENLLPTITKQTNNSILFYCYADVLEGNKFVSVIDFPALMTIKNLELFNHHEISIAVLNLKKTGTSN